MNNLANEKENVKKEATKKIRFPAPIREPNKLKSKKDKKIEPSVQSKFVAMHKDDKELGKKVFEKHSLLYYWKGNAWARLEEHTAESKAYQWLEQTHSALANEKFAKSCVACLKYEVREVPEEPKDTLIPLKNAWLRINTDKNRIEVTNPNRNYFVDYSLNISIPRNEVLSVTVNDELKEYNSLPENIEDGVEIYRPSELPEGSLFKRFIETSMPDPAIRSLLQEYCGYTLMPTIPYQVAQVWEGNGSNGKSVLIAIMQALHKNSRSVDLDNLSPTELNKLIGASLVVSPETPKKAINEQVLKKCISGDLLSVRALYENSIDYKPTAKWIISCNTFPLIQDETNGIWRRLQIFRWEKEFEGKEIIRELEQKIIDKELGIVLDWCLTGLMRLLEREGFDASPIDDQKEEKKIASDNVLQFVRDKGLAVTKARPIFDMRKANVYSDYREYCEVNGLSPSSSEKFWKKVKNKFKGLGEQRRRIDEERVIFVNLFYQW